MIRPLRRIHRGFWLVWPLVLGALLALAVVHRAPDAADAESYRRVTTGETVREGERP